MFSMHLGCRVHRPCGVRESCSRLRTSANRRGDTILTNDPRDLRRLASHTPGIKIIKL